VKKGDVLVRFEVPSSTADLERQQAEVARSRAALETATAAKARAAALFAKGIAARRDVEESTRAAAEAEAAVSQAKAALGSAQTVAARAVVRATFDGVVAKRSHNPGDLVEASASDPVLRVIDPRRLEVVASAPLADAARIRVGAAAHVSGGAVDVGELALRVVGGAVAVEPGTATIPVRLAPAGPMRLPAGTPIDVSIEAERHPTAILIPAAAVVRDGEETSVFVAVSGKAKKRAVKLGLADGGRPHRRSSLSQLGGVRANGRTVDALDDHAARVDQGHHGGIGFHDAHGEVVVAGDVGDPPREGVDGLDVGDGDDVVQLPRFQGGHHGSRPGLGFGGPTDAHRVNLVFGGLGAEQLIEQRVGVERVLDGERTTVDGGALTRRALDEYPAHGSGGQRKP